MDTLWYIVVVVAIFYISWKAVVVIPPQLEEQRTAQYHYVRAGVYCTLGQLAFMFILHRSDLQTGILIPRLCFFTWIATVILILFNVGLSTWTKRFCFSILITASLILLLYPGGTYRFLRDVDDYSVAVMQGTIAKQNSDSANEASADGVATDEEASAEPSKGEGGKGEAKEKAKSEPPTIKQFRVSHIIKMLFLFTQAFLVTSYFSRMWYFKYQNKVKVSASICLGKEAADQIILALSIAFSIWVAFFMLGFDALSVSIFSGLLLVGVSVVLRDLISNFFHGLLLVWEGTISVGDVISIDKTRSGRVIDMTMRYMVIQDRNDIEYLIPHSQLTKETIENWTKGKKQVRLKLDIGVAYGSPIDKVKDIMSSVCFDVPRVLKTPLPNPLIMSMGDSAINCQLRFRIADPENGIRNVMSDVYERLLKRFEEAGIDIPYPQREIRIKNPQQSQEKEASHVVEQPNTATSA